MSKASDAFENEIVTMVTKHLGEALPSELPDWMVDEGIIPGAVITSVDGIGSKSKENKTDVIIKLDKGEPIKISAKLRNADYFGNWYGHKRFIAEFGEDAFERMTEASTNFANKWAKTATAPYVGVSICFGRRLGKQVKTSWIFLHLMIFLLLLVVLVLGIMLPTVCISQIIVQTIFRH